MHSFTLFDRFTCDLLKMTNIQKHEAFAQSQSRIKTASAHLQLVLFTLVRAGSDSSISNSDGLSLGTFLVLLNLLYCYFAKLNFLQTRVVLICYVQNSTNFFLQEGFKSVMERNANAVVVVDIIVVIVTILVDFARVIVIV